VHYYKSGRIGSFVVRKPIILGHECAGEVVAVGKDVKKHRVGDRVAVEPGVPCRRCSFCRTGKYNLCRDVVFLATPPVDGAYCEYITSPEDFTFKIAPNMSFEEGAMIEPLSVGVHACNRGQVKPGDSVAVLGAGPIGLVTLQAARAYGATRVIATDVDARRLALAKKLGATDAVNAARQDSVKEVLRLTDGLGVDIAFETAGAVPTTQQTIGVVRPGGVIVWVGLAAQDVFPIDVMNAICKEVDIRGIFRYANTYRNAIALVAQKRVNVKAMITRRFALDQVPEALAFAASQGKRAIKIMISI
jgi:L-iditol 2-dehydrogenase